MGTWSSLYRTLVQASIRKTQIGCSTLSSPRRPTEWAWGCRSAVRSSKPTEDRCGRPTMPGTEPSSSSACLRLARARPEEHAGAVAGQQAVMLASTIETHLARRRAHGPFIHSYDFRAAASGLRLIRIACHTIPFGTLLSVCRGSSLVSSQIVSIVDDDEGARVATASLVRSLGWQARVFASAEEFLESGLIDETSCLISDIRMPGLSGIELHDRLLALGYAIPIILTTGLPTAALKAKIQARGALPLIEKPFDASTVERLLHLALGRP